MIKVFSRKAYHPLIKLQFDRAAILESLQPDEVACFLFEGRLIGVGILSDIHDSLNPPVRSLALTGLKGNYINWAMSEDSAGSFLVGSTKLQKTMVFLYP